MRKVLYIVSKDLGEAADALLPRADLRERGVSVLLIQEAVALKQSSGDHSCALADDVALREVQSSSPTVSYREMIRMIFEADGVVAL